MEALPIISLKICCRSSLNNLSKKSIKMVEDTAQKIAENFNQDDFNFQGKMKSAIFNNLEEDQELSPEKLADQLFDNNLTARLTFVDELKEAIPEPISVSDIDHFASN